MSPAFLLDLMSIVIGSDVDHFSASFVARMEATELSLYIGIFYEKGCKDLNLGLTRSQFM